MIGDGGKTIALDRGRLDLVTADAFSRHYPECWIPSLPFAGVCGIAVKSLAALEAVLRGADLPARRVDRALIAPFPDELGQGVWRFSE